MDVFGGLHRVSGAEVQLSKCRESRWWDVGCAGTTRWACRAQEPLSGYNRRIPMYSRPTESLLNAAQEFDVPACPARHAGVANQHRKIHTTAILQATLSRPRRRQASFETPSEDSSMQAVFEMAYSSPIQGRGSSHVRQHASILQHDRHK